MTGTNAAVNGEKRSRVVIDTAGAATGGSGRFLAELDAYLSVADNSHSIRVIGRNRRLTPSWLFQRERLARRAEMRIALNNVSFIAPTGRNIVLLRNVLHFGTRKEFMEHEFAPSLELRLQSPIIRATARSANHIVVPTSAMAERVVQHVPSLEPAIRVRAHPVSQRPWAGKTGNSKVGILVPIVPSPYKHLDRHVHALLCATEASELRSVRITVTATTDQLPLVASNPRLNFIGQLPAEQLDRYWRDSLAIYYPTTLEAFGYPLAEARVNGRHVIAQGTAQAAEVAGDSLVGFTLGDQESLINATRYAIAAVPLPDVSTNDPCSYFRWLLGGLV